MNVLYDHQCFTGLSYGGVSRYFYDLMSSLDNRTDVNVKLSLLFSNNEYLAQSSFSHHLGYKKLKNSPNANRLASLINRLYSLQHIRAGKFDVFHPTYYHRYFLDSIPQKPFVLTFYDATSERFGKQYPDLGEGLYEAKKQLLERASAVIAISEFTKQEIIRFFPVNPEKIWVVHLGTQFGQQQSGQLLTYQPEPFPYLLFVGKRGLYKNFDAFFRAIRPVFSQHPDLHLICAGGGMFKANELRMFQEAHLTDRVHYRPITDESLFGMYKNAQAFIFPSLNEGFGLPVLEAFSAGCPVILSDRSSLPEVAADAAVYFDPENDESIAHAVDSVLTNNDLRNDLRQKGTERLRHFSCDQTARQTLAVYQSLL